jgi:hypothetical protein
MPTDIIVFIKPAMWHLSQHPTLVNALIHLCANEFHMTHQFPYLNTPLRFNHHTDITKDWSTWKPKNAEFFTIFKHASGQCCIYSHTLSKTFFSSNLGLMGSKCHPGTAILAQYVEDSHAWDNKMPAVLVFDMLAMTNRLGDNLLHSEPANIRYTVLRTDESGFFHAGSPLTLQWAGEYHSCKQAIHAGTICCPHEIEGILIMNNRDPWSIANEPIDRIITNG